MKGWLIVTSLPLMAGVILTDAERAAPLLLGQVLWLAVTARLAPAPKARSLAEHLLVSMWLVQALVGIYVAAVSQRNNATTNGTGIGLLALAVVGSSVYLWRFAAATKTPKKVKAPSTVEERVALVAPAPVPEPVAVVLKSVAAAAAPPEPESFVFVGVES